MKTFKQWLEAQAVASSSAMPATQQPIKQTATGVALGQEAQKALQDLSKVASKNPSLMSAVLKTSNAVKQNPADTTNSTAALDFANQVKRDLGVR
jgi:hypothetical protein